MTFNRFLKKAGKIRENILLKHWGIHKPQQITFQKIENVLKDLIVSKEFVIISLLKLFQNKLHKHYIGKHYLLVFFNPLIWNFNT